MTAPVELPTVETPEGTPRGPNIQDILDAAKGKIQPLLDQEPIHHSQVQNRAEDGTFATPEPTAPVEVAPVVDPHAPVVAEDEEKPAEEPAVDPNLIVALPGRRPEDPDMEIVADSPEAAERLRQLKNNGLRGDQHQQLLERFDERVRNFEEEQQVINADPVGWLLQSLRENPADLENVALRLMLEPEVWEITQAMAEQLKDPNTRAATKANLELTLRDRKDVLLRQQHDQRLMARAVKDTKAKIRSITPANLTAELREQFEQDALTDLANEARKRSRERNNNGFIHPREVPGLLAARLALYSAIPGSSPAPVAPPVAPAPANRATVRPTGRHFVAGRQARAAVASIPNGGNGSPAVGPLRPPPGLSIEETVAWAKARRTTS